MPAMAHISSLSEVLQEMPMAPRNGVPACDAVILVQPHASRMMMQGGFSFFSTTSASAASTILLGNIEGEFSHSLFP